MVEAGRAKGRMATSHFPIQEGGSREGALRLEELV
jgi:hypothetical protein